MLRVGIVGCGDISPIHGEALKLIDNIEIAAACDIVKEKAINFTETFGGKAYENYKSMLDNESIDVLHICTPHYLHTPMAIEALNRGINVLLEKPVSISINELNELKKTIDRSGKTLGVCYQNRYLPAAQKAYELIYSGEAGKVQGARAFVTWRRDEAYYKASPWRGTLKEGRGGVMINQAIHELDLMFWLVGSPINVECSMKNHHLKGKIEVEDTAEFFIDFGNDVRGLFYASNANCIDAPNILEIFCENMTILISGDELYINNVKKSESAPCNIIGKICWGVGHQLLIADFYDKLQKGEKFPVDILEAEPSIKTVLNLYESGV